MPMPSHSTTISAPSPSVSTTMWMYPSSGRRRRPRGRRSPTSGVSQLLAVKGDRQLARPSGAGDLGLAVASRAARSLRNTAPISGNNATSPAGALARHLPRT